MTSLAQTESLKRWTPFWHHPLQQKVWRTRKRFIGLPCGRGSGKSELAKRRVVRMLPVQKDWPDPRYFYGAPTEQQAKRIAWKDIQALVPKHWIANISFAELCITTVFGSELWVVGLDKPQRIEGVQWDGCILDESSDIKPGTFDRNVFPALTWRNGWCWRIGVPKRQGIGALEYRRFCEAATAGDIEDAETYAWPSSDILPPAQIAWARKNLDSKDYREQFEASWETAGGGVFYEFDGEHNIRPCTYDPELPILVGSDFNVDPMCWCLGHRKGDRLEWFDEIFLRDANTPRTLTMLWERYSSHKGGWEFYGDATGQHRKTSASRSDYQHIMADTRFKAAGRTVHYPRGNPEVTDRFSSCNKHFCNAAGEYRMFVDSTCVHLIEDIQTRHFKAGSNDPADKGDIGHMTDAMGYVVVYLFPVMVELDYIVQQVSTRKV